ncbi:DnaA regulatory inactivator Hda [Balneatrix alpica]|uniref:DnaA regulatory inactivator Hda n=1 Tax=Balneatrix alpica TaxID=75684 RepID=A0ABV5Z8M4_9GAMM|nr:DnaA regulatory inactivator Hda [Balneatrix alpica]
MVAKGPVQLPLWLQLREDATLENFVDQGNELAVASVRGLWQPQAEQFLYLWGSTGAGVSHLLQAACHLAGKAGRAAVYLPMAELADYPVALLENLDQLDLVCLDDIQVIATNPAWQEGVFHLFNRLREQQKPLLVGASMPPRQLPLSLADLQSRLSWGMVLQLQQLDDNGRLQALKLHAHARGMDLPDEVARFILSRAPRGSRALLAVLEKLDDASFAAKRKLTIPFVKTTLGW